MQPPMHSTPSALFPLLILLMTFLEAGAGEYKAYPAYSVKSPRGSFVIGQRARVEEDGWFWQAWICPETASAPSYQLPLWHEGELSWCGNFYISPDERFILHIQKTGSAANDGAVFTRGRDGRFALSRSGDPGLSLSRGAWSFFGRSTGLKSASFRTGLGFVAWGTDGECLELSLRGQDFGGDHFVQDWRLHYHLVSQRFFLTRDQVRHNRRAITVAPFSPSS